MNTLPHWWQNGVIYQIYPKSFQDTTGSGTGDLRGVIMRLDYLKTLGVDAIWLTPFYISPQVDNGYDVANYTAIDPLYGTLEDFDELVAQAKARGIRWCWIWCLTTPPPSTPGFVSLRIPPARTAVLYLARWHTG
jgi:trehalose-6-phosphate hydrolase